MYNVFIFFLIFFYNSRFSISQVQPSLFFDGILSIADLLFANDFYLLEILDNDETSQVWIENIVWLFAACIVLVKKINPSDSSVLNNTGSRFSFVNEAIRNNSIKFFVWFSKYDLRKSTRRTIRENLSVKYKSLITNCLQKSLPNNQQGILSSTAQQRDKVKSFRVQIDMLSDNFYFMKDSHLCKLFEKFISSSGDFLELNLSNKLNNRNRKISRNRKDLRKNFFEIWTENGGKYLSNLFRFLGKSESGDDVRITYINIMCILLENKVDKIRRRKLDLKKKLDLLANESARVQKIQNTLNKFGAIRAILSIVGSYSNPNIEDYRFLHLIPSAFHLGVYLMDTGNHNAQNEFIDTFYESNKWKKRPEMDAFIALRKIIRYCTTTIERNFKLAKEKVTPSIISSTKILIKVFQLCSRVCNGHNEKARKFLREQDRSVRSVDLVQDIATAIICLQEILIAHMKYINYDVFTNKLAPNIWGSINSNKRRFIAWHLQHKECEKVDYNAVCIVMLSLTAGFEVLKDLSQGPCYENQMVALKVSALCPAILEYVGM